MSIYGDVLAGTAGVVENVDAIGRVNVYTRVLSDWDKYLEAFKTTIDGKTQIRGWVVTLRGQNPVTPEPDAFGDIRRVYTVRVYGFLGVQDAVNTEAVMLDLLEALLDALDDADLGLTAVESTGPAALVNYDIRQVGSVLCHYGEIDWPVTARRAVQ